MDVDDEEPAFVHQRNAARGAQVIQIESNKGLLLHSILAAVAIVGTVAFAIMAYNATRETRMLEYYVMELDGKVMQSGIIKPEESWSAQKRKGDEK